MLTIVIVYFSLGSWQNLTCRSNPSGSLVWMNWPKARTRAIFWLLFFLILKAKCDKKASDLQQSTQNDEREESQDLWEKTATQNIHKSPFHQRLLCGKSSLKCCDYRGLEAKDGGLDWQGLPLNRKVLELSGRVARSFRSLTHSLLKKKGQKHWKEVLGSFVICATEEGSNKTYMGFLYSEKDKTVLLCKRKIDPR